MENKKSIKVVELKIRVKAKTPEPEMEQVRPDFRRSQILHGTHNGQPIKYRVCEELIDGRWEGFVSIEGGR